MHYLSVSLLAFGLGSSLLLPATTTTATPPDSSEFRCGVFAASGEPAYPFPSKLVDDLFIGSEDWKMRVATFDIDLSGAQPGALAAALAGAGNAPAEHSAAMIQEANADLVLLTGIDADEAAVSAFITDYLKQPQEGQEAVDYPFFYTGPTNKGAPSGADLDGDKVVGGAADAWGYGEFRGQGSMVLLSKYPIEQDQVKTVTEQRWSQVPGNNMPGSQLGGAIAEAMPVMNSALWEVPVQVNGQSVRVVAMQADDEPSALPYAGARHADQLRVAGDWLSGADYLRDDEGNKAETSDIPYVLIGELGHQNMEPEQLRPLLEATGRTGDAIHDDVNYILPSTDLQIADHGAISQQRAATATPTEGRSAAVSTPELLYSDLTF